MRERGWSAQEDQEWLGQTIVESLLTSRRTNPASLQQADAKPIRIELLGKLRFVFGERLMTSLNTNRLESLFAYLVLHADAAQSREHLAYLLWPESSESQARTNLRQLLHHLRRALPVECSLLVTNNQTVGWRLDNACSIDVIEFEAATALAAEAEKNGDFATAREALEEAARLYQDDLLPELYDEWLRAKREELRMQFAAALARLAGLLEMGGEYPAAIRHAARLVAVDPLRERSYQMLMRLHARNKDRSSALRVYHQCMRVLQRELGISPSKATQDLFTQALRSESLPTVSVELPPHAASTPLSMVGRTAEWKGLLGCWRRAMQGEMHLALIRGEPGIGKSRLAEELLRHCARLADGAAAQARCYFAQGRLAYGPVAEWLRAEPMRLARTQLPRAQLAELARVLPEILVERPEIVAPQPLTESWQRRHLYEALNASFSKAPKPLLLLIDDLQWCDHDSLEWLHSFFQSGSRGHTLVLGTVRPEETGRDHPLTALVTELRQSGQVSEFALAPLNVEEAAALASQVARQECEPAFLSRLYQATHGNPLFVVESVRAWIEDRESKNPAPRVKAVIAARLAQLSPPAYELAGIAATIGRSFSYDLLAKATDWDEDSLTRALEELWQRRIIEEDAGVYDYTHDLLREVAYTELSPVRNRSLHRRVARALEELYAEDLDGVSGWLAAHYEAAGMAEQAIHYYHSAASVARNRFAEAEAADLIRRALKLCRNLPESARRDSEEIHLLATLGLSLVTTHGYSLPEVGETYARGLLLAKRSRDRRHLFSILSGAWAFHIVSGQLEEARRLGELCVEEGRREGKPELATASGFWLGSSQFHLGQLAESLKHLERAAPVFDSLSFSGLAMFASPDIGVFCRSYLSHLLWLAGEAGEAEAKIEEAIQMAREMSPFTHAIALDYAAMLSVFRRESKLALARAQEAAALCRKHGFAYYLAWADILMGWATSLEGDTAAGLLQLRQGIEKLKSTGAELRLPFYYGLLAEACCLAGQVGDALANVANGFAYQSKNGETWSAPELHRIHGDLLVANGDPVEAELSYRRAVESARQAGAVMFERRAAARLERHALEDTRWNAAER
ncbi:MAG TPA: BTAD domain-containing putative transcriptional regulator [Bryobacteraceae bacterium]|nr:BTAD domain-containing putative transcriptional regulator [Bryobacteraceae bacterium]